MKGVPFELSDRMSVKLGVRCDRPQSLERRPMLRRRLQRSRFSREVGAQGKDSATSIDSQTFSWQQFKTLTCRAGEQVITN